MIHTAVRTTKNKKKSIKKAGQSKSHKIEKKT